MTYIPGAAPGASTVTNAMLVNTATARIKGRVTAGTGSPEDLTGTQATTLLDTVTTSLKGLAPASGGGTANYLRADGTWGSPPGAAGGYTVTSISAGYTDATTSGEKVVKVTASGQTIGLATAVGNTAKLTFKLMVAGTLIIDPSGAETIDAGATATLTSQYEAMTIISDNTGWVVI